MEEQISISVWNEEGQKVDFNTLKEGFLIKLSFSSANLGTSSIIGIFRGVENFPSNPHLLIDISSGKFMSNTANMLCEARLQKITFSWINLIEILSCSHHAVHTLFHTIGVLKTKRDNLDRKVRDAIQILN